MYLTESCSRCTYRVCALHSFSSCACFLSYKKLPLFVISTAGSTPWLSTHGQNLDDQHIQLHRSSEGTGAASRDYDGLTKVGYSSLIYQELRGRGGNTAMQRTLYSHFTRVRSCTKSKQLTRRRRCLRWSISVHSLSVHHVSSHQTMYGQPVSPLGFGPA